jgi:hypothetical protein
MSEPVAGAVEPVAAPSPGIADASGQGGAAAATPDVAKNPEPAPAATPSEQAPADPRTPKFRFKDQHEAERAHSELQRRYSRLGDPDHATQRLALLGQLQQDPKFIEWARARLAEQETGSADPETVKALQIVEQVADRKARELMAPLAAQAAQARLAAVFQAMERKHGPEWREYQPKMAELFQRGLQAGYFASGSNFQPSLEFVEGLYAWATGGDPEFAAKAYAKKLAQKHATSTQSSPGVAPAAVNVAPAQTVSEAFRQAKAKLGIA